MVFCVMSGVNYLAWKTKVMFPSRRQLFSRCCSCLEESDYANPLGWEPHPKDSQAHHGPQVTIRDCRAAKADEYLKYICNDSSLQQMTTAAANFPTESLGCHMYVLTNFSRCE